MTDTMRPLPVDCSALLHRLGCGMVRNTISWQVPFVGWRSRCPWCGLYRYVGAVYRIHNDTVSALGRAYDQFMIRETTENVSANLSSRLLRPVTVPVCILQQQPLTALLPRANLNGFNFNPEPR